MKAKALTIRLALATSGLVFVAIAIFQAARLGWAGDVSFSTDRLLSESSRVLPISTLDQARGSLAAAAAAVPSDATLHELLGAVDVRRTASSDSSHEAIGHFVRALELRPVSPYTWASIAAQEYRSGNIGTSFEKAIVNAWRLGPQEPAVQATIANFGLAVWSQVAPATRGAVEAMVANGMRRAPQEMLQIAERRGRLDVACRHFDGPSRRADVKWTQTCQGMEATS